MCREQTLSYGQNHLVHCVYGLNLQVIWQLKSHQHNDYKTKSFIINKLLNNFSF